MSNEQLLDIQRLDVEADQLGHRRANLEQRAQLDESLAEQARQQVEIDALAAQRVEVVTRQKRFEDEAQIVAAKADDDDAKLYGGDVSAMKDLQALQDEIAGLRRRQGNLEDQAIEAMEEGEALVAHLEALEAARGTVDERITVLRAEIAAAEAEIDAELARIAEDRGAAAGSVDADALADYERLRALVRVGHRRAVRRQQLRRLPVHDAGHGARPDEARGSGLGPALPGVRTDRPALTCSSGSWPPPCSVCSSSSTVRRSTNRFVALGGVLPLVETVSGRPLVLHTLLGSVGLMVLVMAATVGRRVLRRRLLGIPIGSFIFLVAAGAWTRTELFWWPVAGLDGIAERPIPEFEPTARRPVAARAHGLRGARVAGAPLRAHRPGESHPAAADRTAPARGIASVTVRRRPRC